ncbi:MAG: hypothetical protein Q7U76_12750 [Nitrospirota bacterium]|nr:hypothetical protein [Nitrospirota bacterium]
MTNQPSDAKGPETWVRYTINKIIREGNDDEDFYLASQVEPWAKEVKEWIEELQETRP